MAKKTKRKVVARKPATQQPPGNWFTRAFFRPRVLLGLALTVSLALATPMLIRRLPDLSQRDEYRLATAGIQINDPPYWVPHDLVEQVVQRAGLGDEVSILDPDITAEIAQAFQLHPWVAKVVRVQKSIPAAVSVELVYRRPVAMVQVKQGMYPVDANGILLPPTDFSVADTKRYPVIQNIQSTPQGPAGTNWGDIAVIGAARLADVLSQPINPEDSHATYWKKFGLTEIQVPRRTETDLSIDDMVFELHTAGGSRIIWGRVPGTGHPGELTAQQKIGRLQEYLTSFGSFDQPHGPCEIEIHHWQSITRRPLSAVDTPRPR